MLKLKDGRYIDIEMQVGNLKDIRHRLEYYISDMTVRQMDEGDDYGKILPVVAIIVLKEPLLAETERFHSEFGMLEKTEHFELHGLRTLHTLELSKLPPGKSGKLEDWLRFIKSEKKEDYMRAAQKSKPMKRALTVLEEASANQEMRNDYVYRIMVKADELARRGYYEDKAKEKGLAEGRAKGMAEGMAKGMAKGKAETAKAMKAEGMPTDVICRITGLTEDDIRRL